MRIQETVRKPMTEAKYLNVDNTDRYRPIIRLFYLKYEKLKYWLYQEEVYEELKEDAYFREYTPEQCQQDLAALTAWGNLVTIQDTRKVATIEEFKNKKFRYQLSEATVEIERMVIRVENLFIESSSLEPTLLERLRINLRKISEITEADQEHIYAWWNDLNNDFIRLNQNYQDYMRELNSVKAEDENDRVSCVQRPFDRVFEKFREESAGQCRIYRTMSEEYGQAGFEVFAGKNYTV